ncbi:MAG: hypothetical protein QOJ00_788, partial [Actinomycetota bacterium]
LELDDRFVAPLAALVGIPASAGYDAVESDARRLRAEIEDAAFAFVNAWFGNGAGVFICEDAHWFDEQTREFVTRAVQQLPPAVLTVVTSRDPLVVPRGSVVATVGLAPLEPADALALVRARTPEGAPTADLDRIVRRGDGIPLFLEELLRTSADGANTDPSPPGATTASGVPESLYEPLVARFNLSPNGSAVAAAAAVIGADADRGVLGIAADLSTAQTEDGLQALLDARIMQPTDFGADRFRFRHELLREVAYDLQPPTRRRAMHARVADALVNGAADTDAVEWQRVAGHYAAAGWVDDAVSAYDHAAERARRRGALSEARLLLTNALDLLLGEPTANAKREIALRLERGFVALTIEGHSSAQAATDYERCLELSLEIGACDEVYATLFAVWSYYSARAEFDRADELLSVLRGFGSDVPDMITALVEGAQGVVDFYRGNFAHAFEVFAQQKRTLGHASEVDVSRWWFVPTDPAAMIEVAGAFAALHAGDVGRVEQVVGNARTICGALPFPRGPFTLSSLLTLEAWIYVELGDFDSGMRVVDEIVEVSARYGFDSWAIVGATQRQVFEGLRILADGAAADNQRNLSALALTIGSYMAMWKMIDQWVFVTYYTTIQGVLHAAAGEPELARAAYDEASAIAARTGMYFYEAETLRHTARLETAVAARTERLRDALALAREQGSVLYELHAAADLAELGGVDDLAVAVAKFAPGVSFPALDAARDLLSRD